jgi:fructose-bisphosphate aldolase class II
MKDILQKAQQNHYGVGSFSVVSMEMVMGTIRAAEETNSPVILQVAEVRLKHAPLHLIGPVMIAAAKAAKIPVAVHLDHGLTIATIEQALDIGFTSVMFDGSHLSLQENIDRTLKIVELAKSYGASVEAEIGQVGGSEDSSQEIEMMITSVEDAKKFFEATQVDALAVAIGNAHGLYKDKPQLQFKRLQDISKNVSVPLVLHGGSGITRADFRKCVHYGIKKINVQTATLNNILEKVKLFFQQNSQSDYFDYQHCIIDAACENVRNHIEAFQSNNQA